MKIIEVPIFNDDGSVQATQLYSPEEAQRLLQFAVNFMLAVGNAGVGNGVNVVDHTEQEFDD